MSRRPRDTKDGRPLGIKEIREAREKADAERRRTFERFKEHQVAIDRERSAREAALTVKRNRFSTLDIREALAAARRLMFVGLDGEGARNEAPLNRPTLGMLELFLTVLRGRGSVMTLQWPRGSRDMSILHPLAMLAMIDSSPERSTGGFKWCAAVADFRTLYYPWRGNATGISQRRILVNRNELIKRNGLHLTRPRVGEAEFSPELGKLHITIGHLHHLKLRDATKPHLAHPTLGELYPTFGALGGENAPSPFDRVVYELFGRVSHGAALDQLHDYRGEIVQPATAPFAFFGICPRSNVKSTLQLPVLTKGRQTDVCILDLGPPGLSRLGPGWEDSIEEFLELLVAFHPETPVFAVTQDVYVHRRVANLLAKVGLIQRTSGSPTYGSRILVRSSEDYFAIDPEIGDVSEVKFQFHSAAGQGAAALRALSEAARASSDPSAAGNLRHSMGNVRRAMSLPCGLALAHEVLNETDAGVETFLERRSAGTALAAIRKQLELCADGAERQTLAQAEIAVNAAFDEFEHDTPIGSMLAVVAAAHSRKSSPSVLAFSSDYELLLGGRRICTDDEQGEQIRKRLASGFMRLVTLQTLDTELAHIESGRSRNSWKRLIVVAPPRDAFAVLLGRRWLPEEIVVLADREFVEGLGKTYAALAAHPDLTGAGKIGSRLANAATAAKTEAQARDVGPIDLHLEVSEKVLADETVIDLTSREEDDGESEVVEFSLESGRTMRVRPGSLVIRHDPFADINPFERATGREITSGDTIVVPNESFVREARAVLPVRILAQTRVQVYHAAIEAALPTLPGPSRTAKARYVIERLRNAGARVVVEATVLDWLNVAEHQLLAPERRRPHAPQHWREFCAFMDVINVPSALAETIWREGIEPLRIDRRRAGARMAQAFVSVLVDPHGGTGLMPTEVKEGIARLRTQAMEHLDGVLSIKRHEPDFTPATRQAARDVLLKSGLIK
jgi:hypothetical protein